MRVAAQFGGLFPGPSKTTRAYLHKEEAVVAALQAAGFAVQRKEVSLRRHCSAAVSM
jgi:magnesium-protoporphyrin O-methyltransferase